MAEESIDRRRGSPKESWIKERNWKFIDDRKTAKNKMQQAKTTPERENTETNYSDMNK